MKVGDEVLYWSPVNRGFYPAKVVDTWADEHVDVLLPGQCYKIRVPIHMKELPEPFLQVRDQRIPLPFVAYETDS